MASLEYFTIEELLQKKAILEMQDGNHGEQHPRQSDFVDKGIPFLTATHVFDNQVFLNLVPRISPDKAKKLRIGWIQPNDVLLSHNATVGRVGVVPQFEGKAVIGTSLTYYRLNPKWFSPDFFALVLSSQEFQRQLEQIMKQTTRNQVPITRQKELIVPVLPISEQKRIAAIAQKADRLRRTRRYALQLSDTYLRSVFLQMFGNPIINSMGWDRVTLSDIKTDFIYGTSTKCYPEPNGLPVLRIPNILGGEIDISDLKYAQLLPKEIEQLSLREGDLLFVRTNGNLDYVGRSAVFNLNDSYLFASYLIRARLNFKKVNPWFVSAYLRTSVGRQVMSPFIRTTAGQFNISVEGLKQIVLPLPPLPLQEKFAQIVQKFERLRTQQREAERQAEHLFQTLLHRAFRGELTPQHANDEPASVLLEEIGAEQAQAEAEAKAATQATGDAAEYLGTKAIQQDTEPIQLKLPGME